MLSQYEPALPLTAMTPSRRKRLAVGGPLVVIGVATALFTLGAGWLLWGVWALGTALTTGVVLLKPSIEFDQTSPDEYILDMEYQRAKKYLSKVEQETFAALEVTTP